MLNSEDWLQDPLMEIGKGRYDYHKLKSLDDKQNDLWRSFHFSTRLKLDAADYFCRRVIGAASMPSYQGLRLLAYEQLHWYLDAFFFELLSAHDILLQELNIIYAYDLGLNTEEVRWKTIKDKLPRELVKYMEQEWEKEWFKKVRQYRNMAAHHSYIWTGSTTGWTGEKTSWDYHQVSIYCLDDTGKAIVERIEECPRYLMKLAEHIQQVWEKMAQEFE